MRVGSWAGGLWERVSTTQCVYRKQKCMWKVEGESRPLLSWSVLLFWSLPLGESFEAGSTVMFLIERTSEGQREALVTSNPVSERFELESLAQFGTRKICAIK